MFDIKRSMDFPRHLGHGNDSPPPRRRKSPSPPRPHQHLHHAHHPALRARDSNRSPSPTFSIDSLADQLHSRLPAASPVSQRPMSPPTPPHGPQPEYFAAPIPGHRPDSATRARQDPRRPSPHYALTPRSDMPAPLRTPSRDNAPTLYAAGFAPPPRPSVTSHRSFQSQHYPSSEDYTRPDRRHASGDYPRGLRDLEQRSPARRAASSEHLSPPRQRRERGPSPLRDHPRDRALPPLPPNAPPELRPQHANSAPTSALFYPDDLRVPPDYAEPRRAASLRTAATAAAAAPRAPPPVDDVDVTDVALFAEALQGLGTPMTLSADTFDPGFGPTALPPPLPPPLDDWAVPPQAPPPPPSMAPAGPLHVPPPPLQQRQPMPPAPPSPPAALPTPAPRSRPGPLNNGWAEVELNEAVLGLGDLATGAPRPPDDELPDYQTSQREAAERSRRAALSRAQELENRWRGSAPFRSR